MSTITIEIIIIVILTFINGLLAMAEIAIVSGRKARLQQLAESPGDFLSTVQVGGITLIGILTGAIVGILREVATPTITQRADGSWLVDGLLPIDDLREMFPLLQLDEEPHSYTTVGGFLLTRFDRIPATGDAFETANFRIEVVDMDGLRVDKVLIVPRITESQ